MRTLDYLPGGEAAAHRAGDARPLRAARAPLRHGEDAVGARGPRVQAPRARRVQGAREAGRAEARRARGADRAARASRSSAQLHEGRDQERRGHRPAEAPLVDLQEDEEAGQAVRGDLRPPRDPRARQHGPRLLPRARRHPRRVDAAAGAHQGLHRAAEVERLPVAAHDGVRARAAAVRDPDPHARDAPHGGVRHRGALAVQGGREERRRARPRTARGSARCSSCSSTRRRRTSSSSSSSSTCIRTRSSSSRRRATSSSCRRARRRSTSRSPCTPRSGLHCAGARSTGASRRSSRAAQELGDGRDHHVAVARSRAATGSRTFARAARATRSGSGCASRSRRTSAKLGREILEREVKRRRLAKPDDAQLRGRRRSRST